ncbi:MAG: helix-turn-helix domain-containing protein, partial [Cytophagales bacterium]
GDFEKAIKENNLTTVDSIADHFETNTVQLNRVFKNFETTPGKFLKKVKLEFAKEMLSKGIEIEEVSKKVGYSPSYIKKELNL